MKLIKRDDARFIFLIGKRERELLFSLLGRYPLVISAHYRTRNPVKSEESKKNQALLEEALTEQQKENRRALEQMLNEPGRFKENELGFTFSLSSYDIEWLLQVLNDIRVGSWVQLGEPDISLKVPPQATEQNVQLAWGLEIAGLFEHSLLEAVHTPDSHDSASAVDSPE